MLNLDVNKTKQDLQTTLGAASAVTNYAQAVLTAVPTLQSPPAWFTPIQGHLSTAQAHASNWLQEICPAVTGGVPRMIVNFNETFQSRSREIVGVLNAIQSGGGQPTSLQRTTIDSLLGNLGAALAAQEKRVAQLLDAIKNHATDVRKDQNILASDLGTVSERFVNGQVWVQKLKALMSENFLDSTVLGPCSSIVEINLSISLKIGGTGSDPSLITLIFARAILENQINNSEAAQQAVQNLLDIWTTLKLKNEAVVNDLQNAKASSYINVLSLVDTETAQVQWQQLSDFASSLLPAQSDTLVSDFGRLESKTQAP